MAEDLRCTSFRALIVEDDDIDFRAISRSLAKGPTPVEYDRVYVLADASEIIKRQKYDIILSDMNLPDSNGLDTINSLLRIVGETPIVVLSGNDDEVVALEAVHAGAQDFLPKQYINDAMLIHRTVRHAMERHQLKLGLEKTRDRERFLAHFDQCTSLPNRLLFLDRLHQAVMQAQRNQNKFSLFFVDLDRFKIINDSLGHSAGDEVLRCVGERMKTLVRECDTVARFGGDEFVLILQLSDSYKAMQRLAAQLIDAISKPIPFGHHICSVGASIGIASYPRHGYSPEALIKNADMAMYEAKKQGRNRVQFFTQEIFEQQSRFFCLEKALRETLNNPEESFELHYQPKVELRSGKVRSVEALIRWSHKKLGNIPPDQFIPLAEDLGLIGQIDEWVLEEACKKAREWRNMQYDVCIAVNISGYSFNRQDFVTEVVEPLLQQYQLDGDCIEMEITEGVLLADSERVTRRLESLKSLGISLAIDDFGTGFSSLNYLNNFPIDTLKIDGCFVCDQHASDSERALLEAIIALGKALKMKVVAECVETEAQHQYLCSLDCHEGQGYYWHKPDANWMPSDTDYAPAAITIATKRASGGQ